MPDHVPNTNTEPLSDPISGTIQAEICLQSLSVYEKLGATVQSLSHLLKPLSHGPGQPHSISVYVLALLLSHPVEVLKQWAAAGDCFIKLVWIFPGWNHPEFTTRHLLVTDTAPGHVSFSGGLDWAEDMWKAAQRVQPPTCPFVGRPVPVPPPRWNLTPRPQGPGNAKPQLLRQPAVPFMVMPHWKSRSQPLAYRPLYRPHSLAREQEPDSVSEPSSEEPGLTDAASEASSAVFSEPAEMAPEDSNSGKDPNFGKDSNFGEDPWHTEPVSDSSSRARLDALRRKKREAEALYARNGDPSGLLALLAEASQSADNWDASGMPRF